MDPGSSPLLTDLYQLNMIEAYLAYGETKTAVFELFVRKLPTRRGFLVAAGLEQALEFLGELRFSEGEIDWLKRSGRFSVSTLDYLAQLRFSGDVHAMAEGTVFFGNEPILRVTAPLPEAQLVEARLINILHFQTVIASKAARMVLAAPGKLLVDFGLRRAHEAEAGLMAARASYIAGFAGTATVLAGRRFDIPVFGTMAHSYIQANDNEAVANLLKALHRGGHLLLFVPAFQSLYSPLDRLAGHHRRYRRRELAQLVPPEMGQIVRNEYFNPVGGFGWWINKFMPYNSLNDSAVNTQVRLFDQYVLPVSRCLNPLTRSIFGQSIVCAVRRS